ncbi:MAG: hypothetical protein HDS75_04560 [Bacteroidales bacterium]|nr:hypothetical protein [Bacteroidales bacterium]
MKLFVRILLTLTIFGSIAACNDEVFVTLHPEETPGTTPPDDQPEPEFTDSLVLRSLEYIPDSIHLDDEIWVQKGVTRFYNHDSQGTMYVLLDNHNSTLVSINNTTYYVTPWAKESQPLISIPYLDPASETISLRPDFMPFKFGITSVSGQLRGGETDSLTIPANTMVQATVYTTRRRITAKADIAYFFTDFQQQTETGWVVVTVWQPIDIRVEWSSVLPIEEPR